MAWMKLLIIHGFNNKIKIMFNEKTNILTYIIKILKIILALDL